MKILDAGTEPLENAAVHSWIQRKRAQHTREDAEWHTLVEAKKLPPQLDSSKDKKTAKFNLQKEIVHERPENLLRSLELHEAYLGDERFGHPWLRNGSFYFPAQERERRIGVFVERCVQIVSIPFEERFAAAMDLNGGLGELRRRQEMKELSDGELLVLCNLAPTCRELLEPILEDWEERFTAEEMDAIVAVCCEVWRGEELGIEPGTAAPAETYPEPADEGERNGYDGDGQENGYEEYGEEYDHDGQDRDVDGGADEMEE